MVTFSCAFCPVTSELKQSSILDKTDAIKLPAYDEVFPHPYDHFAKKMKLYFPSPNTMHPTLNGGDRGRDTVLQNVSKGYYKIC